MLHKYNVCRKHDSSSWEATLEPYPVAWIAVLQNKTSWPRPNSLVGCVCGAGDWEAAAWKEKVRSCDDAAGLREALGTLEVAIRDGWLSPLFKRAPLLVKGAWLPTGALLHKPHTSLLSQSAML